MPSAFEIAYDQTRSTVTCRALDDALRTQPDAHRFLEALRRVGPLLGRAHQRRSSDVNELADEVIAS